MIQEVKHNQFSILKIFIDKLKKLVKIDANTEK